MKKILIAAVFLLGILTLSGCVNKNDTSGAMATDNSEIIFFYGSTCPHCKIVEDFVAKNNVESKVSFSKREVYGDQANANLMMDLQKKCGFDKSIVGAVPFLKTKDKCYSGDKDIIQFFQDKLNAQNGNQ